MTTPTITPTTAPLSTTEVVSVEFSKVAGALWLLGTALICLMAIYVIGIDEGMTSVFGKTLAIHEFVHDGRHFLGFPCH